MNLASGLYCGHVVHVRLRPRRHKLRYAVFSLLLDLDELPTLGAQSPLFGHNRAAVFSFWDKDHGEGKNLRVWVESQLADAGVAVANPQIRVLCYPRIFGYVFNPLTVYFCADRSGTLRAILYEVCNTFGERRTYVIPLLDGQPTDLVRHGCAKELYVSPFVGMDCRYGFHIVPPADAVMLRIDETDPEGLLLRAVFAGQRQDFTDRALFGALLRYPLMTLKVMGAIHFEALRLWLKGVPVFRHRPAEARIARTIVPHGGRAP